MWRRQTFCCRPVCPMLCARVLGGRNTVDETWRAAITLNLSPAPARCSLLSLTLTVEGGFRNSRVDRERSCCCCSPAPCPHSRGCTGPRRWMAWVWLGTGAEAKRRIARKFKPKKRLDQARPLTMTLAAGDLADKKWHDLSRPAPPRGNCG